MKRLLIITSLWLLCSCNVLNLDGSKPIFKIQDGGTNGANSLDAWGYDPLSTTHVSAWSMGQGGDRTLTLPINNSTNHYYNFTIDWGDGTIASHGSPSTTGRDLVGASFETPISHTYAEDGVYTIEITGTFEGWNFVFGSNTSNDNNKLVRVHSFGDLGYKDISNGFRSCTNLVHFGGGYTKNVTQMYSMFEGASSITSLDLSSFDTENVSGMNYMFDGASNLTYLDLSSFNTSNVMFMHYMFSGTTNLTSLDLSNFDTSSVTNMSWMFSFASSLTTLDLSNFDTSRVNSMVRMFNQATALESLNLTNWNTIPNNGDRSDTLSYTNWLYQTTSLDKTTDIICNDPDNGGIGAAGSGQVNLETCN